MPNKMIIGLTGPTGAGKSSLKKVFKSLGCVYIDTDKLARRVTEKGSPSLERMARVFGKDIILEDGELDRQKLAKRAFASKVSAAVLNLLSHPTIIDMTVDIIKKSDRSVAVIDAPLLYEAGMDRICDSVIAVTAHEEKRLERIMCRDKIDSENAKMRMSAQHDSAWYRARADFVIENNDDLASLEYKAKELYRQITEAKP